MKTPSTIIVAFCMLFIIGLKPQLSAIHPIPLDRASVFVDGYHLTKNNTPKTEDKKEKKRYELLTNLILLFWILLILSCLNSIYCNVKRLTNPDTKCFRYVGVSIYCLALLTLIRNKFTKRYERKKAEARRRRKERLKRRQERIKRLQEEEIEEEEEDIIVF